MITSRLILLKMRNVLHTNYRENQTRVLYSVTFLRNSCRLWDNVEEYTTARQATDDNRIRRRKAAICLPDNYRKYTVMHLRSLTHRSFTATVFTDCATLCHYTYIACRFRPYKKWKAAWYQIHTSLCFVWHFLQASSSRVCLLFNEIWRKNRLCRLMRKWKNHAQWTVML